jgi:hypothetical protein
MSASVLTCLLLLSAATDGEADPTRLDEPALAAQADAAFNEGVQQRGDANLARPCFLRAIACLLTDDLPGAILAYRRGLRLVPYDEELRSSLESARGRVVASPARPAAERPPAWLAIAPAWWFAAATLFYALTCVGVLRWRMTRQAWPLRLTIVGFAAATGLVVAGVQASRVGGETRTLVVIVRDGTILRQGNGAAYPPRLDAKLNRGVEAVLLFERDGWLQIELANGVVGWVQQDNARIDREP